MYMQEKEKFIDFWSDNHLYNISYFVPLYLTPLSELSGLLAIDSLIKQMAQEEASGL